MQTACRTPEQIKAWSQNLGHEGVLTTFYSYGCVAQNRQGEIIKDLANPPALAATQADEIAAAVLRNLEQRGVALR